MMIIPVKTLEDGSIVAEYPAPDDAVMTVTTPNGVAVYMQGDELPAEYQQLNPLRRVFSFPSESC